MKNLSITVPGIPIAKKRPRFVRRGKFVTAYNCQETEEGRWLWEVTKQLEADFKLITDPIDINMTFFMPIPISTSKKKMHEMIDAPHTKKPDVDNCIKFCLDCLNGVLFSDDRQIYKLSAVKVYSFLPRTEIIVRW